MRAVCSCSLFSFPFLFSLLAGALAAGLVDAFGGFIPRLIGSFASTNRLSIKRDVRFANCPRRADQTQFSAQFSTQVTTHCSLLTRQCAVMRSCTHALPTQLHARTTCAVQRTLPAQSHTRTHYLRSRTHALPTQSHARTTCAVARTHYLRSRTHALPGAQSHAHTTCAVARTH